MKRRFGITRVAVYSSTLMTFSSLMLCFMLCGCSSSSKKSDNPGATSSNAPSEQPAQAVQASGSDAELGADGEETSAPTPDEMPTSSPKTNDQKYQPLAQAVRGGRAKAIVAEAGKILGTNSNDPVALNALAMDHLRHGRSGAARLLLVRALEKNPGNAGLLNNLAVVDLTENEQGAAISGFKKALKADSNHAQASANLGSIYVRGGDFTRAISLLSAAYKAGRLNGAALNAYAIALRANGELDGAQKIYEELIKRDPRDVNAHLNYAILLIDFLNKPKDGLALVYKVKFLETEKKDVVAKANALEKKAKAALQ